MKKFTLFLLLCMAALCLPQDVLAEASYAVTTETDGTVVITKYDANDNVDMSSSAITLPSNTFTGHETVASATKLKLVGYFSSTDFNYIKDTGVHPVELDLSGAMLDQSSENEEKSYYVVLRDEEGHQYTQDVIRDPSAVGTDHEYYYVDTNNVTHYYADKDVEDRREVTGGQRIPADWNSSLTTLSLPTSADYKNIGCDFCNGLTKLTSITIPTNIEIIGANAFSGCEGLTSVAFSAPSHLTVIAYHAFYQTSLPTVTIPGTVEYVGFYAFGVIDELTSVVFAEAGDGETAAAHITIQSSAFFNSQNIADVYVQNETTAIDCVNGAFDYRVTWGHGDPTSAKCTLHFPKSKASNYANLQHPLTMEEAADAAKFHIWLLAHYQQAGDYENGWYEFVNNGTIDPDPNAPSSGYGNKFLRTYCDMDNDRIVPRGVKAYIVNSIDDEKQITLQQLFVIPKGTGVILYGVPNSTDANGKKVLTMSLATISDGYSIRRSVWENDGEKLKNYLEPTGTGVTVAPYEMSGNTVTFRNFGMGRFGSTSPGKAYSGTLPSNYVGFFRLKAGTMGAGKAYLRFSSSEYSDARGGEAIIIADTKPITGYESILHYQVEYSRTDGKPEAPATSGYWATTDDPGPNMTWADDSNWGNRGAFATNSDPFPLAKFLDEPFVDFETTGIETAEVENAKEDGAFYSVQGVKTMNPTHGIYIKNGKKIVIK